MTGCYSHRANVWHTIGGRNHLDTGLATMGERFQASGYRTGLFGKWHLGDAYPLRPMDRGFDEWLGQGDGGVGTMTNYWGNNRVDDMYIHNGELERHDEYTADVFFDAAMSFIRDQAAQDQPYFVYLPTYIPHDPCSLPDRAWAERLKEKVPLETAYFLASVERADYHLGRLRELLDETGQADNTILIFMTDNGTAGGREVFNAGMRGQKGSVYEGGHRVPCFLHWPAGGCDSGRDCDVLTAHVDLLPTLEQWCSLEPPETCGPHDGWPLTGLIAGDAQEEDRFAERTLVVENQRFDRPGPEGSYVVMQGSWRLVNGEELYDVSTDPGQQANRIQDPKLQTLVTKMSGAYQTYWADVSRGDERDIAVCIGSDQQPVVCLTAESMNHIDGPWIWNQLHVTQGVRSKGLWPVDAEVSGTYRIAVRRWPQEIDAPMQSECPPLAVPIRKAFLFDEEVDEVLYAAAKGESGSVALPIAAVRLRVDGVQKVQEVTPDMSEAVFEVFLEAGRRRIEADFSDSDGLDLGTAYYVVVQRVEMFTSSQEPPI
jgi:arylsulfatase A-like enzyme